MRRVILWVFAVALAAGLLGLGALIVRRLPEAGEQERPSNAAPAAAPVEVAPVETGVIRDRRTFSGTLEAAALATVAPKVSGRIVRLPVDISDPVKRGDIVAELEDAEFVQAVTQAEAELAVAEANVAQAQSAAEIAARELDRVRTLQERGVASESQLDTVVADNLAKEAAVKVARSQVLRAEAALESARIRLSYCTVRAEWSGGDDSRVVAERFVEEGETLAANTPLVSIIELNPIEAVIFVTERDYARLGPEQTVTLATDAYPGRAWTGRVARVAPVFREASRQARVEILVPNEEGLLKPGMFVRVEVVFGSEEDTTIVPAAALAKRDGRSVVFVVSEDGGSVRMLPVEVGIREGERVQVEGQGVRGRVVVLGQQLVEDGSAITVPGDAEAAPGQSTERAGGGAAAENGGTG